MIAVLVMRLHAKIIVNLLFKFAVLPIKIVVETAKGGLNIAKNSRNFFPEWLPGYLPELKNNISFR